MEFLRHIGINKAILEQVQNLLIYKILEINIYILLMMLFKNMDRTFQNMNNQINFHIASFKDIYNILIHQKITILKKI